MRKIIESTFAAVPGAATRTRVLILFNLLICLFIAVSGLNAQAKSEEYQLVKAYSLPDTAIAWSELSETKPQPGAASSLMSYRGALFSGISYERYKNKSLSRVQTYKNGILDGPSYVWYPDGAPQMYVNYKQGALSGRFMGWYMHGGILYDMVINSAGYAGDYIEDGRSADTAGGDEDGEGDAQVNDKE